MVFQKFELQHGHTTIDSFSSILQIGWLQLVFHFYLEGGSVPRKNSASVIFYLIFNVTIENTTQRMLTIQKRVTILASWYPSFW